MHSALKFAHAHYFESIEKGTWEACPALQAADFIAYGGFKLTKQYKRGVEDLRKSLQSAIRHGIPIRAGFYRGQGLKDLSESFLSLLKGESAPEVI
jgi:hypothetical protein